MVYDRSAKRGRTDLWTCAIEGSTDETRSTTSKVMLRRAIEASEALASPLRRDHSTVEPELGRTSNTLCNRRGVNTCRSTITR